MLAVHTFARASLEYAKQRCTAYPRYVIQRRLLPHLLMCTSPMVRDLEVWHPAVGKCDTTRCLCSGFFDPSFSYLLKSPLANHFEEALDKGAAIDLPWVP
jgi:hypothetical protein